MANHRPDLRLVTAKQREIKRRYAHHRKVTRRSSPMAAIRLAELTRWLNDVNGAGTELDPTDASEQLARIFVHHLIVLPSGERRASEWLAIYCPWISLRGRETLISEANHCPLKWKARSLGWKLKLTDEQRTRLKITTIAPIDVTPEQLASRRKAKRAALMRALRAKRKAEREQHIG